MTSPGRIPARAAGEPGTTEATTTPALDLGPPGVRANCGWIPIQGRRTTPWARRSSATRRARFIGMAKPIPTEPPLGEKIELLTPITSPDAFTSGPPEFPGLIDASV